MQRYPKNGNAQHAMKMAVSKGGNPSGRTRESFRRSADGRSILI